MATWKRLVLKAAGFGAGAVLAATIVFGSVFWYTTRPQKVKPWNPNAITAEYYNVSTAGESDSRLQFQYVLENKTDKDYELQTRSPLKIAGKLQDTNSLTGFSDEGSIVIELPVFIPARQKTRIKITLPNYGFKSRRQLTDSSSPEERHKYHVDVATYVADKMGNLDGFVLFDETSRYEIEFPNGWAKVAEEKETKLAGKEPVNQTKH